MSTATVHTAPCTIVRGPGMPSAARSELFATTPCGTTYRATHRCPSGPWTGPARCAELDAVLDAVRHERAGCAR